MATVSATTDKVHVAKIQNVNGSTSAVAATNDILSTDLAQNLQPIKAECQIRHFCPQDQILTTSLPTPIQVDSLATLLVGYKDADYIISSFKNGFMLDFEGPNTPYFASNSSSVVQNPVAVENKLLIELNSSRIAGPFKNPPLHNFKVSPLAVREKGDGKHRLLHNLSFPYNSDAVNHNIPDSSSKVKYESFNDAITLVNSFENAWIAKADIAEAFRLIPLNPNQYNLTGFFYKGFYYDRCLPMGCSSSCLIFERFSSSLKWILSEHYKVKHVVKVLDDFLFVGSTYEDCMQSLAAFKHMCSKTGVPIANHKTEGPSKCLTFLGIELDTDNMMARLPKDKLLNYYKNVDSLLASKSCTLRTLKSVIGQLQFSCSVVTSGRPFLRRLYDATIGIKQPHHYIKITNKIRQDLLVWKKIPKILQWNYYHSQAHTIDLNRAPHVHGQLYDGLWWSV